MPAQAVGTDESVRLTFRPVTKATRDDFVALFEARGGPSYCWCMAYRLTPEEKGATTGAARRPLMLARIDRRVPVGLIGYPMASRSPGSRSRRARPSTARSAAPSRRTARPSGR